MIRVVVTHPDGRIGARTVPAAGYLPLAIGEIVHRFGGEPHSFRLKIFDVEPDELDAAADAHRIARRLIANVGRKLIQHGMED